LFVERQFRISHCDDARLQDPTYLAGLAAVIFSQAPDKPLQIERQLRMHAERLLDHDCRVIVRPSSRHVGIVKNTLGSLNLPNVGIRASGRGEPPFPHIRVFSPNIPWSIIADFLLMYPPGPAPSPTLKIEPASLGQKLSSQREILIRRAFSDCSEIYLMAMEGGRSAGVSVYRAHAELKAGLLRSQWPLPLFIKIGKRRKIFAEYENYEGRVDPYVPFHLGPHLVRDRCCLGAREGVIVGDYVDESECLTSCASEGRASSAIACLFDRTLIGWHRSARKEGGSSISRLLASFFPATIPPSRLARAKTLGATNDLPKLRSLFDHCTSSPVLVGPIHGDLHAKNVRVRATDAVVIDFYGHRDCPLLFDAAMLEASLLVEGFGKEGRGDQDWIKSIEVLYSGRPLLAETAHSNPKDSSSWFYACVHQIRRYARQWQIHEHQYAGALAAALLSKAAKDEYAQDPEGLRRAAAYVFAEQILLSAFGSLPSSSSIGRVPAAPPTSGAAPAASPSLAVRTNKLGTRA
jgi:hypothetical protein